MSLKTGTRIAKAFHTLVKEAQSVYNRPAYGREERRFGRKMRDLLLCGSGLPLLSRWP